jgi:hypothetical protein
MYASGPLEERRIELQQAIEGLHDTIRYSENH